ncbi:MAG: leucine-rich repeat protein [Oscillospiraceae bacterium]
MKRSIALFLALALCVGLLGILPVHADSDFVITDGVLLAYYGPGGDVVIPDGVTAIGERVFFRRTDVTGVTIPDGVTSICSHAFYGCANLSDVSLPNSLSTIGSYAFAMCCVLTDITIPSSVAVLGDHAFFECTGLTDVTVPGSVAVIDEYTFYGCSSLTSAAIRYGVQKIGFAAFGNCPKLASLTVPSSVTYMDGAMSGLGDIHRFVVYGYNGSAAKTWALSNAWTGAEFVALDDRNPFSDVTEPDYFLEPVIWAVENGVTNGTGASTFSPDQTCTRGQIVTFLYRALANP